MNQTNRRKMITPMVLVLLMLVSAMPLGPVGTASASRDLYLYGDLFVLDSEHGKVFGVDLSTAIRESSAESAVVSEAYLMTDGSQRVDATPLGIAHDLNDMYISFDDGSVHHWTQVTTMYLGNEFGTGLWEWQTQDTIPQLVLDGPLFPITIQPNAVSLDIYDEDRLLYTNGINSKVYTLDRTTLASTGIQEVWDSDLSTLTPNDYVEFTRGEGIEQINHRFTGVSTYEMSEVDSNGDEITSQAIYGMSTSVGSLSRMDFVSSTRADGWQYDVEAPVKVGTTPISIDAIDTIGNVWNSTSESGYSWYEGANISADDPTPVHFIRSDDTIRLFREVSSYYTDDPNSRTPWSPGRTRSPLHSQIQAGIEDIGGTHTNTFPQHLATDVEFHPSVVSSAQFPAWTTMAIPPLFTHADEDGTTDITGGTIDLSFGGDTKEDMHLLNFITFPSGLKTLEWNVEPHELLPDESSPIPSPMRFEITGHSPGKEGLSASVSVVRPSRTVSSDLSPTTEADIFALSDESGALWLNGVRYESIYEIVLPSWSSEYADISIHIPSFNVPDFNPISGDLGNLEITSVRPVQSVFDVDDLVVGKYTAFEVTFEAEPSTLQVLGETTEIELPEITIEIDLQGFFTCAPNPETAGAQCYDGKVRYRITPEAGVNTVIIPDDGRAYVVPLGWDDDSWPVEHAGVDYNLNRIADTSEYSVVIDADEDMVEADEEDNDVEKTIGITKPRFGQLSIAIVPIRLMNDGVVVEAAPANPNLYAARGEALLRDMYPIAAGDTGLTVDVLPTQDVEQGWRKGVTNRRVVSAVKEHTDRFDKAYGLLADFDFIETYMSNDIPIPPTINHMNLLGTADCKGVWGYFEDDSGDTTFVHEVGHNFDLRHDHNTEQEKCGDKDNSDWEEEIDGFSIQSHQLRQSCSHDTRFSPCYRSIMRYNFDENSDGTEADIAHGRGEWIQKTDFEWLLYQWYLDPELLFISGELNQSGDGWIERASYVPDGMLTLANDSTGTHTFTILDSSGNTLREVGFNISYFDADGNEQDYFSFAHRLGWVDGTARVELHDDSGLISSWDFSQSSPTVSDVVVSPDPSTGLDSITWSASDADGDPLTYDILARGLEDETWRKIAWGLSDMSFEVDLASSFSASDLEVMVVANDGGLTGQSIGDPVPLTTFSLTLGAESNAPIEARGTKFYALSLERYGGFTGDVNMSLASPVPGLQVTWMNGSTVEYDGTDTQQFLVRVDRHMDVASGLHRLSFVAESGAKVETVRVAIKIADGGPSARFSSFEDGESVECESGNCPPLTIDAFDAQGISNVVFKLDGVVLANQTESPFTIQLNEVNFTNGNRTLTATAFDSSGHYTTRSLNLFSLVSGGDSTSDELGEEPAEEGENETGQDSAPEASNMVGPLAVESWITLVAGLILGLLIMRVAGRKD